LTLNGKINFAELSTLADIRQQSAARREDHWMGKQTLYTPTEEVLAGIWAQVLKLEQVDSKQNFFELGGHSLLATQVISRIREAFGVNLPVKSLFANHTIAKLAEIVEQQRAAGRTVEVPPIGKVKREAGSPLSYAQQRLWFMHQLEPESAAYNIPYAVRLMGALDLEALQRAMGEVVRRHEVLRTRFVSRGGQPLQVIDERHELALPLEDLSQIEAKEEREQQARAVAL